MGVESDFSFLYSSGVSPESFRESGVIAVRILYKQNAPPEGGAFFGNLRALFKRELVRAGKHNGGELGLRLRYAIL